MPDVVCLPCSLLKLPSGIASAPDLLAEAQVKKASALKSGQKKVDAKVGPVLTAKAKHADGLTTELQLQVGTVFAACQQCPSYHASTVQKLGRVAPI